MSEDPRHGVSGFLGAIDGASRLFPFTVTSGYRPGVKVRGTGRPSYHSIRAGAGDLQIPGAGQAEHEALRDWFIGQGYHAIVEAPGSKFASPGNKGFIVHVERRAPKRIGTETPAPSATIGKALKTAKAEAAKGRGRPGWAESAFGAFTDVARGIAEMPVGVVKTGVAAAELIPGVKKVTGGVRKGIAAYERGLEGNLPTSGLAGESAARFGGGLAAFIGTPPLTKAWELLELGAGPLARMAPRALQGVIRPAVAGATWGATEEAGRERYEGEPMQAGQIAKAAGMGAALPAAAGALTTGLPAAMRLLFPKRATAPLPVAPRVEVPAPKEKPVGPLGAVLPQKPQVFRVFRAGVGKPKPHIPDPIDTEGIYFATDREHAQAYAGMLTDTAGKPIAEVGEYEVSLRNPANDKVEQEILGRLGALEEEGGLLLPRDANQARQVRTELEGAGYDGIVRSTGEVIAFNGDAVNPVAEAIRGMEGRKEAALPSVETVTAPSPTPVAPAPPAPKPPVKLTKGLPAPVVAAIDALPEPLQSEARQNIRRVVITRQVEGEGGRYLPAEKGIAFESAEAARDADTIRHEVLHAAATAPHEPAKLEVWLRSRYPAETLAEHPDWIEAAKQGRLGDPFVEEAWVQSIESPAPPIPPVLSRAEGSKVEGPVEAAPKSAPAKVPGKALTRDTAIQAVSERARGRTPTKITDLKPGDHFIEWGGEGHGVLQRVVKVYKRYLTAEPYNPTGDQPGTFGEPTKQSFTRYTSSVGTGRSELITRYGAVLTNAEKRAILGKTPAPAPAKVGAAKAAAPETTKPTFLVDHQGTIARVTGWEADGTPIVAYPGKAGGIKPGTAQQGGGAPYEYRLTGKWRPATPDDFVKAIKPSKSEKMIALRMWREEFGRQNRAAAAPEMKAKAEAANKAGRREIIETRLRMNKDVRQQDLDEFPDLAEKYGRIGQPAPAPPVPSGVEGKKAVVGRVAPTAPEVMVSGRRNLSELSPAEYIDRTAIEIRRRGTENLEKIESGQLPASSERAAREDLVRAERYRRGEWDEDLRDHRRRQIESALRAGRPVYEGWRTDYPDLAKAFPEQAVPAPAAPAMAVKEYPELELPRPGLTVRAVGRAPTVTPAEPQRPGRFSFENPETEARFQAAKRGKTDVPLIERLRDAATRFRNIATRTFETLPRGGRFADIGEGLRRLGHERAIQGARAAERLQEIVLPLRRDPAAYDLFVRRVVLDDLADGTPSGKLPFDLTPESLNAEAGRLDAAIAADPRISKAVAERRAQWKEVTDAYIEANKAVGFDVTGRVKREHYFRHQVLMYLEGQRLAGAGGARGMHVKTGRGFLRERAGSALDISTNYLEAEWEVMAQMMHDTQAARFLKQVADSKHNIVEQLKAHAKAEEIEDWHTLIPDGYRGYQPREGSVFYLADSVPERLVREATEKGLEEVGIPLETIRKVLARGGKFREMVIPDEVADTLANFGKGASQHWSARAARRIMNSWKQYQLINPKRWFNYNARNLSGDTDAVARGNPSTLRAANLRESTAELKEVFTSTKPATGELREWQNRGGQQGLQQAQEMGDINELGRLLEVLDKAPPGGVRRVWQGYWRTARLTTDFREGILRYATFKDVLHQMQADTKAGGEGRPRNFGASKPDEVMALPDLYDRAYKISNELLGAYDQVTPFGTWLSTYMYPFWRWQEINVSREIGLARNAFTTGKGAGYLGKQVPKAALQIGVKGTKYLFGVTAALSLAQVWNLTVFPDIEEALPDDQKGRPHLILGGTPRNPRVLWRLGAVGDLLEWAGLDEAPSDVRMILNGQMPVAEWLAKSATAPARKLLGGLGPHFRTPYEYASRKATYPDITKGAPIRDMPAKLARDFSVEPEFVAATGRPQRKSFLESAKDIFGTTLDTDESSYYEIQDLKRRFIETKLDKEVPVAGGGDTKRSTELWQLKRAMRWGDVAAIRKYATRYAQQGGSVKGFRQSIRSFEPIYGLKGSDAAAFRAWLTGDQSRKLERAESYYKRMEPHFGVAEGIIDRTKPRTSRAAVGRAR